MSMFKNPTDQLVAQKLGEYELHRIRMGWALDASQKEIARMGALLDAKDAEIAALKASQELTQAVVEAPAVVDTKH